MAVAFGIQHDLDLECLVHCTTRDRNLMALESELLGAHALGVRNIIALTGDPPRVGDYPTGTGVWDVDSIGPDRDPHAAQPRRGPGGSARSASRPAFTIACALDPTAADAATEWDRLERKLAAGRAPGHDPAALRRSSRSRRCSRRRARRFGRAAFPVPVLLGVLPLVSRAPRRVPPQRGARDHDPGRRAGGDGARPASAARRSASRWPTSCSRAMEGEVAGHVHHAELRALRAVRGARPPDPRRAHPRGGRGVTRVRSRAVAGSRSPARTSSASGSSCSTGRWARCSRRTARPRRTSAASGSRDHPRDLRGNSDLLVPDPARTSFATSTPRTSMPAPTSSQHELVHRDAHRPGRLRLRAATSSAR